MCLCVCVCVCERERERENDDNNDKKKKNWRNRLFAISPMFVVQFSPNFRCTYILALAIILRCQKWIITESESVNLKFQMDRPNGPRPRPSLQSTTVLCDKGEILLHITGYPW